MSNVAINIAAEYTGKPAFDKAKKATTSLDKAVGKLGKQIASVFAVSKIYAYGKASVKAFAEDEKAALSLARTVKNLGLEFGTQGAAVNNYISNLEQQTGVLDDELRPALDRLLRSTLSITKAQELLNLALDIAAGTGKSVTQVSQSLQKAYLGQTQALGRLGVGLSKAELTSSSFEKIQKRLTYLFAGQAQDAANSYAGQIDRLTIASNNAKETIGKGLVDALALAGGKKGDVQNVADAMQSLSEYTANASRGVGVLIGKLTDLDKEKSGGLFSKLLSGNFKYSLIGQLAALGERNSGEGTGQGSSTIENYRASAAAKAAEAKRVKELAALQKKQLTATKALTAEQKKQNALKKAASIFDLEQIQIIAALQGNLSKDEETRLKAQLALLNGNATVATSLTKQILMSQDATGNLYKLWQTLPDAKNPFAYLEEWLKAFQGKLNATQFPVPVSGISVGTGQGGSVAENYRLDQIKTNVAPMPSTADIARLAAPMSSGSSTIGDYLNVTLQIDGKTIATALQDQSLSGIPSGVNRTYGSFAGR
jgi:hypothetical protein